MKELVEVLETVAQVTKYNNNRIVKLEQQTTATDKRTKTVD
jgi:hypothetical protein